MAAMQTMVLIANRFPNDFRVISNKGILIKAIQVPIDKLNTWLSTIAKPAVPPVAMWLGDKKPTMPNAITALPSRMNK